MDVPTSPYERESQDKERNIHNHLKNPLHSKENVKRMKLFRAEYCMNRNLAMGTQESYIRSISFFGLWLKKDFKKAKKEDMQEYLASLSKKSKSVQDWAKIAFKVFYRWLLTGKTGRYDAFPEIVSWIRIGYARPKQIRPEDCITIDELEKMVVVAKNARDPALLHVLIDTGGRGGEILNSQVKDLHLETDLPYIDFPRSKTDPRPVYIFDSVPYLKTWLEAHPFRHQDDFDECFLFVPIGKGNGKQKKFMVVSELWNRVQEIKKQAGIRRHIWTHLFRHSAASFDTQSGMNDDMKNIKYGWSTNSKMSRRYSHITAKDVANFQRKMRGLDAVEVKNPRLPKKCPRCGENNTWDKEFCGKCAQPLSQKAVHGNMEMQNTILELKEQYSELSQLIKKDWRKKFEKKIGVVKKG